MASGSDPHETPATTSDDVDSGAPPAPLPPEDIALLEKLPEELVRQLYPDLATGPLTLTLVYPRSQACERATALEAKATEHSVDEAERGRPARHRTSFTLVQIESFHELYHLVEASAGTGSVEVLVNGHALPLIRELWLPLLWSLRR